MRTPLFFAGRKPRMCTVRRCSVGVDSARDGLFQSDLVGSTYDTVLHARDNCQTQTELACHDDFVAVQSGLQFNATESQTYLLVVDSFSSANAGEYTRNIAQGCP